MKLNGGKNMDEKKKRKKENLKNAAIAGSSYETVQRYGAAAKQHYVAYSGEDNEIGKTLKKSLKSISKEDGNNNYEFQRIHQKAGFAAEVKDVARTNDDYIIKGNSTRKIRTDDLGRVNDPLYDSVLIDSDGNIIEGSGAQMKFLGASKKDPTGENSAARALSKLQSKKFQKYLDADAKIDVPSDQYDNLVQEANKKIDNLSKQLDRLKETGNTEQAKKIQNQIKQLKKIKKNLRKSTLSTEEAVDAVKHPVLSTANDVARISHRAGIETAESSALIGGSVSMVKNLVLYCKGEIDGDEAVKNVVIETGNSAAMGYGTGVAGSALKGAMQNSKLKSVRALSKTNIAGSIVSVTVSANRTMSQYFNDEIDEEECMEELGEQVTGTISSAMFAAIGKKAIASQIVGSLIGGMVGYALASVCYSLLTKTLKEAKLAKKQRQQIEKACDEHIKMLREYRAEMDKIVNEYLSDSMDVFRESFSGIKNALNIGDVDWVIESANTITEKFGGKTGFSNMEEFEKMMAQDGTLIL